MPDAQRTFEDVLVPLAERGLAKMLSDDKAVFCYKARADSEGRLVLSGVSKRYSAMVLIGRAARRQCGLDSGPSHPEVWDALVHWAKGEALAGDTGLVLWALCLAQDDRADEIADRAIEKAFEVVNRPVRPGSMPMGWLLTGLSEAAALGLAGDRATEAASGVYQRLLANRGEATGMFVSGGGLSRWRRLGRAVRARLGSFAAQVYPTIGLSRYAAVTGCEEALSAAARCADRLCDLQGPQGQWWWIYNITKGRPAIRYPVYGVHQDAMGPMMLLAVRNAGGKPYNDSLARSLAWLDRHPECPDLDMVDSHNALVWRAIQREEESTTGAFGLARGERFRMNWAAWTGRLDNRPFGTGYRCNECRPYHLGWILLASAMLTGSRGPGE